MNLSTKLAVSLALCYSPLQAQVLSSPNSNMNSSVKTDLLFARKTDTGFTWTLASRLQQIFSIATDQFGPKDSTYTLLGYEFLADASQQPQVWFPKPGKYIIIQLSTSAAEDTERALFQAAHEAIHCLSPIEGLRANVLEEGLAAYFQEEYMRKYVRSDMNWHSELPSYVAARDLVGELLAIDRDIVKRVRAIQPTIFKITSQQLMQVHPKVTRELAEKLCTNFNYGR